MVGKYFGKVLLIVLQLSIIVNISPINPQSVDALMENRSTDRSADQSNTSAQVATLIAGPLSKSAANPRYFADPSGRIVYLTGSHTWCNLMDCDDANPIAATFNYTAFLDFLVARNHNFFRLWRAENARGGEAGPNFWFDPLPYQRSTTCCAFDGGNKFNLTQFNQAYFDRMRSRIIAARDRGIYVSVMLFDGWSVESKLGNHNPWDGHPYKDTNNVSGIDGDTNNDNQGGETHTLASAQITALQEAYVRKVIDTVNDLDNVLYEISNESPSNSEAWQYQMINYVRNYEATKPKQHPIGMTWEWPGGNNNDLYTSPADWISLGGAGDINTYVPPVATGNKIIIADTDHLCGICGSHQWVWKSFTRGENPIFMDIYNDATSGRGLPFSHPPDEVAIRLNLGYTRNYATRMNLAAMTPQPALCSTGYCLANAVSSGAEYLAYLPNAGSITINLSATPGRLSVEWFNPNTGATTNGGTVNGGASRTLSAPFGGDAVLYLSLVNTTITIGRNLTGSYYVPSGGRVTPLFPGLQNGPVEVLSDVPVFTSERALFGPNRTFNEVMGFPHNQLTNHYWFPWYDGRDMNTWILVGNPSSIQPANVTIRVAGQQVYSNQIGPNGIVTPLFPNLQNGPVEVLSDVPVFTSERALFGRPASFSEVFGYPHNQLTNHYWFPWYDGRDMSTWILVGSP